MRYSVQIDKSIDAFAYCMNKVNDEICNIWDWSISVNACGIDYGIYFNFDIKDMHLEISNCAMYDESLYLEDIIEQINEWYEDEDEDEGEELLVVNYEEAEEMGYELNIMTEWNGNSVFVDYGEAELNADGEVFDVEVELIDGEDDEDDE